MLYFQYGQSRQDEEWAASFEVARASARLPTLGAAEKQQALLGNTLLDKSVEAALAVPAEGGDFSLENPEKSLLWNMPSIQFLKIMYPTFVVSFDQCCFGSLHFKPTTVLTSQALLQALSARCKGGHKHVPLKGKVWNKKDRKWVFRTKAAQVYPKPLCEAIAQKVSGVFFEDCPQFAQSFLLRSLDRKRPLGMSKAWLQHRQNRSAMLAQAASYQLKRGAVKPLLDVECEPGDAKHVRFEDLRTCCVKTGPGNEKNGKYSGVMI